MLAGVPYQYCFQFFLLLQICLKNNDGVAINMLIKSEGVLSLFILYCVAFVFSWWLTTHKYDTGLNKDEKSLLCSYVFQLSCSAHVLHINDADMSGCPKNQTNFHEPMRHTPYRIVVLIMVLTLSTCWTIY